MFSQLFKNRLIRFLLLAIISIQAYALPPDIEKDKLMKQLEKALVANNFEKAETVFKKLEPLRKEHGLKMPKTYWYFRGQTQLNVGNPSEAIKHLETYLEEAGKKAGYYDKALELYGLAEEMQIEIKLKPIKRLEKLRTEKIQKAKSEYANTISDVTGQYVWSDRYNTHKENYTKVNIKWSFAKTSQICELKYDRFFKREEDLSRECKGNTTATSQSLFKFGDISYFGPVQSNVNSQDRDENQKIDYSVQISFREDLIYKSKEDTYEQCPLKNKSKDYSRSFFYIKFSSSAKANAFLNAMKQLKNNCEIIALENK